MSKLDKFLRYPRDNGHIKKISAESEHHQVTTDPPGYNAKENWIRDAISLSNAPAHDHHQDSIKPGKYDLHLILASSVLAAFMEAVSFLVSYNVGNYYISDNMLLTASALPNVLTDGLLIASEAFIATSLIFGTLVISRPAFSKINVKTELIVLCNFIIWIVFCVFNATQNRLEVSDEKIQVLIYYPLINCTALVLLMVFNLIMFAALKFKHSKNRSAVKSKR